MLNCIKVISNESLRPLQTVKMAVYHKESLDRPMMVRNWPLKSATFDQVSAIFESTIKSPADFGLQCGRMYDIACITANQTQKNLFLLYIFTVSVVSSGLIMIEIMYSVLMFIIHNPICRSRTT